MTLVLNPYPQYKESGLPWVGTFPAHWKTERAKWLFQRMQRPPRPQDGVVTCFRDGRVTLRRNRRLDGFTESLKEIGYQGVRSGDLVIHAMDAFAGAIGVSDSDGKSTPVYAVCQPRTKLDVEYYARVVREMARMQWIAALARGIRERSTDFRYETFANEWLPFPPVEEQVLIASYALQVDRKTSNLIRAKRQVIELLNEQKQALIHRAVTHGLTPGVRLRPSGVEWIGDVPEHWEVKRLKWVTRLQRGYDLPSDQRQSGSVPVVSSGGVIGTHSEARAESPGVVMGRYGSTDAVFFMEEAFWPHNTALFVTDFHGNNRRWCFYMLRAISKVDLASKSAVPGVDRKDLYQINVPVPPVDEQSSLVGAIEKELETFEDAVCSALRQISLIREYHTRVIADVVTGKLDVRDVSFAEIGEADDAESQRDGADGELLDAGPLLVDEGGTDAE